MSAESGADAYAERRATRLAALRRIERFPGLDSEEREAVQTSIRGLGGTVDVGGLPTGAQAPKLDRTDPQIRGDLDRLVRLESRAVHTYGELVRQHQLLIGEARDVDQEIAEANLDLEGIRAGIVALGGTPQPPTPV